MPLIRHKTTGVEVDVPDAKAALPYFPDYEEVKSDKPGGEKSTAKTTDKE